MTKKKRVVEAKAQEINSIDYWFKLTKELFGISNRQKNAIYDLLMSLGKKY